jgi:2-oxoglutarate dehydrogenase E2 component (dihydrolipoamide succinyltransferase)
MPQMGESIAEGTITKWLKKVGDHVDRDEPLFEISTDKVDAEIPSPVAGTLTEIKFKEGDTVEVNIVLAVLEGEGVGTSVAASPAAPIEAPKEEPAPPPEPETAPPPPPVESAPPLTAARELESAKPPAAPPSAESARPQTAPATSVKPVSAAAPPASLSGPGPAKDAGKTSTVEEMRRTKSSPLVRKIASEHGINIANLAGTGMSGRVTRNDILSFIESGGAAAPTIPAVQPGRAPTAAAVTPPIEPVAPPPIKPAAGDRIEQMTVIRKKIAEHMVTSRRTSAHVTTVYEIDMTKIARLRDQHKASFLERTGTKLTFMPFIFQAITKGLRKFPIFNAQVSGDQIVYKRDVNLGLAVALDWGLIVPVIKRADDLSLSGLARAANDLADRARTKQLKPDEVAGGTFTITNPGVFGGLFGTPIINQPQVAILGVGKIEKRAKVMTTAEGEDYIAARWMAYFALSFDHRIIDGSDAERFLAFVKEQLEAGDFTI